jgi:DNA-binding transcriptional MerR regulator
MDAADALLSVGSVGRRTGLTPKALRHYDRIKLFRPAVVDPAGYRWYTRQQLADARLIAVLRAVDVPLEDVRRCLDATTDRASTVAAVLAAHRRRLEARLTRIQRDLHDIGHLAIDRLDTLMGSSDATPHATSGIEDERALAAALFNATWELLEKENRNRDEDDAMLHMAHASRHYWGQVGTPVHRTRGEWQCSRVYAVLGRPEPCVHHAQRVLDLAHEHKLVPFDIAFAYEALARGYALAGDPEQARAYLEQARAVAEDIAEPGERELLLADLETIAKPSPGSHAE